MESKTSGPYLSATTLDDLMRAVIDETLAHGEWIRVTKGEAIEITGIFLELTDTRARLSRTETRGKPFSCLGELCWYLAKSNDLAFIEYYIRQYKEYADGGEIYGGYGPRLFDWKGLNQVETVIKTLTRKPSSRQAVIQLFDAQDLVGKHKDVPCTCTLQFMIRGKKLNLLTNMRSNDIFWGMPHDIFCFTMLQEIIARSLGVEPGTYKHAVGSLHLYKETVDAAQRFIEEGWQPTEAIMPPMPVGDPWPSISALLGAESVIRSRGELDESGLNKLDPYWQDLIHLLEVFRHKKARAPEPIQVLRQKMSSDAYLPFIDSVLSRLT
jgi:thymidylate synthase